MSGIALIARHGGRPVERAELQRLLESMAHRGPNGLRAWVGDGIALGQCNLLTDRDDAPGPLAADGDRPACVLALDGHLDNRAELSRLLGLASGLCDAQIVLAAFGRWGASCFPRLRGRVATVVVDGATRRAHVYRTPLVGQALFYRRANGTLMVASEEAVIARSSSHRVELNDHWLSEYFNRRTPPDNSTVFEGIEELLPGELLEWSGGKLRVSRTPPGLGATPVRYGKDEEYAEHYYDLLQRAVATAVGRATTVGIMLSSGMDSAPLACLASAQLLPTGRTLTAYSWRLASFPEVDESRQISRCVEYNRMPVRWIDGEHLAPLDDLDALPIGPNWPLSNPYSRLRYGLYRAAARDGCKVLLSGNFGDGLYAPGKYRVRDMLRDRRWQLLWGELRGVYNEGGMGGAFKDDAVRQVVKDCIRWSARAPAPPEHATDWAATHIATDARWPPEATQSPRPDQYGAMLGLETARGICATAYHTNQFGIEWREPYVNWELVDFMLSIPGYLCERRGEKKLISRLAMKGRMPETLRTQRRVGNLRPIFDDGFERNRSGIEAQLRRNDALWPKFVRRKWLDAVVAKARLSTREKLVVWRCAALELWRQRYGY